jgi:hypothetical protein
LLGCKYIFKASDARATKLSNLRYCYAVVRFREQRKAETTRFMPNLIRWTCLSKAGLLSVICALITALLAELPLSTIHRPTGWLCRLNESLCGRIRLSLVDHDGGCMDCSGSVIDVLINLTRAAAFRPTTKCRQKRVMSDS